MGGFKYGMMSEDQRPSVNVEHGRTDPLAQLLLEAGATMSDAERDKYQMQPLDAAGRAALTEIMNNRRSVSNGAPDLFDMYRWPMAAPGPLPAGPAVLGALIAGAPLQGPSFRQDVDDALLAQSIGDILSGVPAQQSNFSSALNEATGPIDWNIIARLYGQRHQ